MKWIYYFISSLYECIFKNYTNMYFDCISFYEKAYHECISQVNEEKIFFLDTVENLHLYCEQYLKLQYFQIPDYYSNDSFQDSEKICLKFVSCLFVEFSNDKEFFGILNNAKIINNIENLNFRTSLQQRIYLINNNIPFQELYFANFKRFNSLNSIFGLSERDLYIPLYGKYLTTLNNTIFNLEKEVLKFSQLKNKNNVLFLLGEAGQGKSTFVRTYFCKHFFEKMNIFLFKFIDVFPKMFFKNEINIHNFFRYYGISHKFLENGLIILDGLDELAGELFSISLTITNFVNMLEDSLYTYAPNCKVIITSRAQDTKDKLFGYKMITISSLNYYDQRNWIIRYSTMSSSKDFTLNDLHNVRKNSKELRQLIEIPLLFEIIVSKNFKYKVNNRVELFEKLFYETINTNYPPRALHRLFENIAFKEFVQGTGTTIPASQVKDLYHQIFIEFYFKPNDIVGLQFVHRSFFQHFLAYYFVHSLINTTLTQDSISSFLKKLSYRRLDSFELYNIKFIVQNENLYLNSNQISLIFEEIKHHNCIYDADNNALLKANVIFVNCINLVNIMSKETIQLTSSQKKAFNYLLKMFDNFGIHLTKFDLSYFSLVGAKFTNANLKGVNMSGCDLARADFCCADLSYADISGSYLRGADIRGANLEYSDLSECNLSNSYLSGCNMRNCNLTDAYLINANMLAADLTDAILKHSIMQGTILNEAIYSIEQLQEACKNEKDIITYIEEVQK